MQIDKNIPIPPRYGRRTSYVMLDEMEVGDSFAVVPPFKLKNLRASLSKDAKRHGRRFTVQRHGDGYRCWRVS